MKEPGDFLTIIKLDGKTLQTTVRVDAGIQMVGKLVGMMAGLHFIG
ncbi:hypothetical protein ACWF7H_06600 [Peribacillus butanolivorans]